MKSDNKITRILVTDNHEVFRKAFITLLSQNKFVNVIGDATNGLEALDFLAKNRIDIVFLDIEMPVMNGKETLINIKAKFPLVKVIMFTSHDERSLTDSYMELGADAYLIKSTPPERIFETIRQL